MSMQPPQLRLIVGLGNPGRKYHRTPHNVGFECVDRLATECGLTWTSSRRIDAEIAEGPTKVGPLCLMKPTTYMNLSGRAVAGWLRNKPVELDQILIVTDDVNLPLGKIRIRPGGSAGGHNGLKSIIACLGDEQFSRLRIGVDPGLAIYDLSAFVLATLPARERAILDESIGLSVEAIFTWLEDGHRSAMNKFNGRVIEPP